VGAHCDGIGRQDSADSAGCFQGSRFPGLIHPNAQGFNLSRKYSENSAALRWRRWRHRRSTVYLTPVTVPPM
jgi:hypothetical protein